VRNLLDPNSFPLPSNELQIFLTLCENIALYKMLLGGSSFSKEVIMAILKILGAIFILIMYVDGYLSLAEKINIWPYKKNV